MRGSTVDNQGSYLTSNERRILRNYQEGSGAGRGSDFAERLNRIAEPFTASEPQHAANIQRVRTLLSRIRDGVTASTMQYNG